MYDKLTENDIKKMQEEIDYRKLVVRPKELEAVKEARAQGDLSENFEYKAAKQDKNRNESRIRYLEKMIKTAHVISDTSKDDEVGILGVVPLHPRRPKRDQASDLRRLLRRAIGPQIEVRAIGVVEVQPRAARRTRAQEVGILAAVISEGVAPKRLRAFAGRDVQDDRADAQHQLCVTTGVPIGAQS